MFCRYFSFVRETYHLDGFVVSDCSAVQTIMTGHNYTHTVQDTVAVALHAGTDINCGSFYSEYAQQALDNKTIVEDDIDQALIRAFTVLVRLGYFDPAEQQPYRQITKDAVDTNRSRQLALEAAEQGIVLLKNVNKALPLNLNQLKNKTIALIGPTANITQILKGNYNGIAPFLVDPRTALLQYTADHNVNVSYAYGCHVSDDDQSGFAAAIELARVADIVIFFGGINQSIEAEARDRTYISLPDIQLTLIQQLEKISRSPLHIVMMSGGGLDLSYIRDSNKCASLLWMSYAGQSAGHAITHVLFGQYNPGGRLPITYYPASYVDTVPESDMQMRPSATSPGRTYKFYRGEAIFEFGYGLSYTTFNYSWINHTIDTTNISIKSLIDKDEKRYHTQVFRVNVTNTGEMTGSDVVLAFIIPPQQSFVDPSPPIKKLFGFQRIFLEINQTSELYFPLNIRSLLMVAENGSKWLESGSYHILIGKQQIYTIHLQGQSIQWL